MIKFVQFCCEISIGFAVPHSTVPLIPGGLISGDLSPGIYIRGLPSRRLFPRDLSPGTYPRGLIPGEQPPVISRFQAFQTWHHCISALILVDFRTFKYCFSITRPGNNLDTMTIDHVYGILYKVFYVYYFKAVLYDWQKLIIKCFCNSYSNNWESKHFKNSYSMKLIK